MDPYAKGAVLGLTLSTEKADLIKGMLEGITYEMRLNLDCLEEAGVTIRSLRAIGGGAKSALWLRLKANIFRRPVCSLSVSEAACLGAALLAGVAVGEYGSLAEAVGRTLRVKDTYEPDPAEADQYEERYQLYREIYPTLKDLMHRI
jgi:xylulokinase